MAEDPFVAAAERVAAAGRTACEAIESAVQALEVGRRARSSGTSLVEIVDEMISAGGRDVRLSAADAFHEFERAVGDLRTRVVCMLVDEDGLSLTDVARRLRISRQAVARLYRDASSGHAPSDVDA